MLFIKICKVEVVVNVKLMLFYFYGFFFWNVVENCLYNVNRK